MPNPIKDFIKNQLKVESPGPGRFFTAYKDSFTVDGTDLMAKYDDILKSIGDGQPNPNKVKDFFTLVDSSLEAIFAEIQQENPSVVLDEQQKADIKFSMIFKFPGYLLKTKTASAEPGDLVAVTQQYQALNGQSPVLTSLAQKYFVNESKDIAANMAVFYDDAYQKVLNYFQGGVNRVNSSNVSNARDLAKEMQLEANLNYKALPQAYKDQLSSDLWNVHLAHKAKGNPYPISLSDFDSLVISTLSKVASTTVESMAQTMTERHNFTPEEIEWMKTTPISKVVMGKDYADQRDSSMMYFDLSTKDSNAPGLKISARASTHHEFRGNVLREMITSCLISKCY